jgi:hypothetical protein
LHSSKNTLAIYSKECDSKVSKVDTTVSTTAVNAPPTTTLPDFQSMSIEEQNDLIEVFCDAAKSGNLAKLKEYISKGIDKEVKGNFGYTA